MRFSTATVLVAVVSCSQNQKAEVADKPKSQEETVTPRVVSLFNSATEILYALGIVDQVVGVDVTSKYPEQVKGLPQLGHYPNFNAEGIISLGPTVVLARKDEVKPELKAQLEQVGIQLILFEQNFSVDGTAKLIREVAKAVDAKGVEQIIENVKSEIKNLPELPYAPKLLFIYARSNGPLMVSGDNTQLSELFKLVGAKNAVSGFDKYQQLSPEALVKANPDAIVVFQSAMPALNNGENLWATQGMENTKAGKSKALIVLDEMKASSFGPRLGEAVLELNEALRELHE